MEIAQMACHITFQFMTNSDKRVSYSETGELLLGVLAVENDPL